GGGPDNASQRAISLKGSFAAGELHHQLLEHYARRQRSRALQGKVGFEQPIVKLQRSRTEEPQMLENPFLLERRQPRLAHRRCYRSSLLAKPRDLCFAP